MNQKQRIRSGRVGGMEKKSTTTKKKLVYAYCVVDSNKIIEGPAPIFSPKSKDYHEEDKLGLENLYLVPFQDICAVVSKVPKSEFNQEAINENTKKIGWLTKTATKHEELVEFIMNKFETPIPLKLCTIFENDANVEKMLKRNYAKFSQLLKEVEGKAEFGVTSYVSLDPEELLHRSTSKEVKSLRKSIDHASKGRAYFLKQELQDTLRSEFRAKALTSSRAIYEELKPFADRAVLNNPLNTDLVGSSKHQAQKNEMILNAAFLVNKGQLQEFQRRAQELKDEFGPKGISIRLSGPWPPYNFGQ